MESLVGIMEIVGLQAEVKTKILNLNLNLEDYALEIADLLDLRTAVAAKNRLKEMLEPDEGNFKILACMLSAMLKTLENYRLKKIAENIFVETMKAFPRFLNEHYSSYNKWAFDRDWWTYRQLAMTIFRIGELEYELKELEDIKSISIHIPSDANLRIEQVLKSLKSAKSFFQEYYPDYSNVFYSCRSWMLSSDLKGLLKEDSNILKFQSLFTIESEKYGSKGFMKWIYNGYYDDYNLLPEATSLQKNLKQYLLAGNDVSVAYGILKDKLEFNLKKF